MAFNREKMMFSRTSKDVELNVPVKCDFCFKVNNLECDPDKHNGNIERIDLKIIGIPWAKLNYIKSQCISFNDKEQTRFDSQQYLSECLKQMIVEAPWGNTDDIFLMQVGGALGAELEKIIPNAYGTQDDSQKENDFATIKKE